MDNIHVVQSWAHAFCYLGNVAEIRLQEHSNIDFIIMYMYSFKRTVIVNYLRKLKKAKT